MVDHRLQGPVVEVQIPQFFIGPEGGGRSCRRAKFEPGRSEHSLFDLQLLLGRLELGRLLNCLLLLECDRIYYGVIIDASDRSGSAFRGGSAACGNMPKNEFEFGRNRHAHEISHCLGLYHSVHHTFTHSDCPQKPAGKKYGPCCSYADPIAPDFPYIYQVQGTNRATIGPMNLGHDNYIYGFDAYKKSVVDPHENFELMSYCGSWRWISDVTYNAIRQEINQRFSAPISSAVMHENDQVEYLIIRGSIEFDHDSVELLPFLHVNSSVNLPMPAPGDYTLLLLNEAEEIINEIDFEPSRFVADFPQEE